MAARTPTRGLSLGAALAEMATAVEASAVTAPAERALPSVATRADLRDYLLQTFGAKIPDKAVCANHQAPWDAFCAAYFATHSMIVIEASRGFGGKTFLLGLLATAEATLLHADVAMLGGSGMQSKRVHAAMTSFWNYPGAPRDLLLTEPGKMRTEFQWGNAVEALTASQKSARGVHPSRLILDEVDEMDLAIFDAAMGQTMAARGVAAQTVISSTHQNPNGTFTEVLKRAVDRSWPVFRWCVAAYTMVSTPAGGTPISELLPGDEVYGWGGASVVRGRVAAAWRTCEVMATLRLELTDGRVVDCTPDHELLTASGWRHARDCVSGDWLVSEVRRDSSISFNRAGEQERVVSHVLADESWQRAQAAVPPLSAARAKQKSEGVRQVPSRGFSSAKSYAREYDGYEQSALRQVGEDEQGRGAVSGGASGMRDSLRTAPGHYDVQPRLLVARLRARIRGLWTLLASRYRAGNSTSTRDRERRVSVSSSMGRSTAPVVEGAWRYVGVERVVAGPIVDVWDCCVPSLNSFIAEGVVAHNCPRETVEPHGWLEASEIARKRAEMTDLMWRTEVELEEPTAQGLAITREAVEAMFDQELGESDGATGRDEIFQASMKSGAYAHGADWGKRHDYTAIATIRTDQEPFRFVAFYRDRKRPYHLMMAVLNSRQAKYGGPVTHDANGVGEHAREMLTGDSIEHYTQWQGQPRHMLFNDYINAIERGLVRAPRSRPWLDAHKYVTNDDLYGTGHPPDEFVGCALAYRAATHGAGELAFAGGVASVPKPASEAEQADREKTRKDEARRVVEDAVRKQGTYWPGGGRGGGLR
mgnify:CR=1 FL=1